MSGEKNTNVPVRDLSVKQGFKLSKFLVSWEMVLIYILFLINVVLMVSRTNLYFSPGTIQAIIQSGMDVCPLVLGMILILMLGDIDVSVASTMIFASMATGLCCQAGMPAFVGVIVGIAAGALCGLFNGYFVAYVEMPAVIVTIATSMLFRGIVKIILDVNVLKQFPSFYTTVAWTNIAGIPLSLILFLVMGAVFVFLLQKSRFGRKLYIIGNNATCAQYSGIDVRKTKLIVFVLMGVMCGVASIFFVGRMGGSVSSTMGTGYEMTAIAICVLGRRIHKRRKRKGLRTDHRNIDHGVPYLYTWSFGSGCQYEKDRNRIYPDHRSPDPECEQTADRKSEAEICL